MKNINENTNKNDKKRIHKKHEWGQVWGVEMDFRENMRVSRRNRTNQYAKTLIIKILKDATKTQTFLTIEQIVLKVRDEISRDKLSKYNIEKVTYMTVYNLLRRCRERYNNDNADPEGYPLTKIIYINGREVIAFCWSRAI